MTGENIYEMSEADVKEKYVVPALEAAGWTDEQIEREAKMTDGQIKFLTAKKTTRDKAKYADLLLSLRPNYPLAIIEVKKAKFAPDHGIQQAINYSFGYNGDSILFNSDGTRADWGVPFVYSTNGQRFVEHDFFTGQEREFGMNEFPSPDALRERYMREYDPGDGSKPGVTEAQEVVMAQPYYYNTDRSPRYYQRIAINRTVELIARGRQRLLLVMATGTGKTYTAFQIVWRLLKSRQRQKILYLADRNILVDQSLQQDFAPLAKVAHKISAKDDKTTLRAYQVYFALYQQLDGDEGEIPPYKELFEPDFFDLVIVDECHRSSAKEEGRWRQILEYFSGATQIGMTATPKETRDVSNIDYFGDPIYVYSLREGIADGFLAPYRVIDVSTNVGEGWRPIAGQVDVNGVPIEDRIYNNKDYDRNLVLEDRVRVVAEKITEFLKANDRMAKTIVFCVDSEHAARMRSALVQLNADMVKKYPDYVVRITANDDEGSKKLKVFCNVKSATPVIATTSELLSTGVDCKMVKLIVLDKSIGSMTQFKQILGRGTRLNENNGKTFFVVMDFRNVTNLFADPEWDGPVIQDPVFEPGGTRKHGDGDDDPSTPEPTLPPGFPKVKPIVDANGCKVFVTVEKVSVYDSDGRLLRTESIRDYTKSSLLGEYASLESFIREWSTKEKRKEIRDLLWTKCGLSLEELMEEEGLTDVDDFDYLCHVAFDRKLLTRRERADNVKKRDFLSKYSGAAREVLEALVEKYAVVGVDEIEGFRILQTEPFTQYGQPAKIVALFGGKDGYLNALRELEEELYREAI